MGLVDCTRFSSTRRDVSARYAAETALGRNVKLDEVAEAITFSASDRAAFISGECLRVTGGFIGGLYTSHLPHEPSAGQTRAGLMRKPNG